MSTASCSRSWTLVRALASRACSTARSRCSFSSWPRLIASFSWSLYASRFLSAKRRASNVSTLVLASFPSSIARCSSCPDRATSRAATVIELMPGVGTQIGDVLDEKGPHRSVGGGQIVVLLLDSGQVLEVPRRLLDQV